MLHLVGGWLFDETGQEGEDVIAHNRNTQVSYTAIRHDHLWGYEWRVLEAFDPADPLPEDLLAFCKDRRKAFRPRFAT